jgi:hypothetical protein
VTAARGIFGGVAIDLAREIRKRCVEGDRVIIRFAASLSLELLERAPIGMLTAG